MAAGTTIRTCSCKHEYQEEKYGASKRVFNRFSKGWRCTVCGKTHEVREEATPKK